jgi:hypothetical protein
MMMASCVAVDGEKREEKNACWSTSIVMVEGSTVKSDFISS